MQGSSLLKIEKLQKIFMKLQETFTRDEKHNRNNPIFSFSLSKKDESYYDYLKERKSKIITKSNPEINAYNSNNGVESALLLDKLLKYVGFQRKILSVDKLFKKNTLIDIKSLKFKNIEHGNKFKKKAIQTANEMETFQQYDFIKRLHIKSNDGRKFLFNMVNKNYLSSNAMANDAICTFDSIHFKEKNLYQFLDSINLLTFIKNNIHNPSLLVFYLRLDQSVTDLKDLYFKCQSNEEIYALITRIRAIKKYGKFKSLMNESPTAIISAFFTGLNENNIGFKSVNKVGELLTKATVTNSIDIQIAEEFKILVALLEKLHIDMIALQKKLIT